ncbi:MULTISPECIES: SurA N-terminal domain-containing protein [Lactobacillaceae]|uniref:Uncharacterized protein n=1 Tax=Agrilactobacillus yilanensis TaxID=2485997 RepID=A0ABW4J5R1_9LACO|nr:MULTISPECIES: hypothetical protein [Lactobacillaceae]KRN63718.1 hypothetical protein IV83_GL000011 [Pediococcus inopinatus]
MFKNLKKQVRPWDYIIFLILLIVSFIPLAIFGYSQKQQLAAAADNNTKPIIYAEISIDKKVIKKRVFGFYGGKGLINHPSPNS